MGPADDIRAEAARLGFDAVRFTAARLPEAAGDALDGFLSQGYAGDMDWLTATRARRRSPERMWPDAATAIVLGVNYGPAGDPLAILRQRDRGGISVYAQNDDYHDVIKKRLKSLARWIAGRFDAGVKVFVDTAPLMEKPLAARAGLGWQGKHTNLVSREFGSWLFLGAILTTLDLPADAPEVDHCGSCRACLDICPTGAFPAPRPDRCAPLHQLSHHRAQGADPARPASPDRQPDLRVRRLPGRLSVEQVCPVDRRTGFPAARRTGRAATGRPRRA